MFGCTDSAQVLKELDECKKEYPEAFIRIIGFDNVRVTLRSSYARAIIELRADVKLKDNIVAAMPKIAEEGYYTCNIRVEYE
ncbi:Rop guanine nucleotide exchange factor 5 [Tanacetum coccineum]